VRSVEVVMIGLSYLLPATLQRILLDLVNHDNYQLIMETPN